MCRAAPPGVSPQPLGGPHRLSGFPVTRTREHTVEIEKRGSEPDPDHGFTPLILELEQYGGTLTVRDRRLSVPGSRTVHLHLPDDEYRQQKCREIIKEWHSAGS